MPKVPANPEDEVDASEEQDGEAGEEEEYEIEAVLGHQHGRFEAGKMGYLVKWKGYDESENSWITAEDAENAQGAIDEYWDKVKRKNKGGRKSEVKPKPAPKEKKVRDETPDGDSSTSAKKRRRASKVQSDSDMEVEEVVPKKSVRTGRASTTMKSATPAKQTPAKKKAPISVSDEEMDEDGAFTDMTDFYHLDSWEQMLSKVDTVERGDNGRLVVYFTLADGKRVKEDNKICKQKFPQSLLNFYESNLKWKTAES